jgi:hypothetical protein
MFAPREEAVSDRCAVIEEEAKIRVGGIRVSGVSRQLADMLHGQQRKEVVLEISSGIGSIRLALVAEQWRSLRGDSVRIQVHQGAEHGAVLRTVSVRAIGDQRIEATDDRFEELFGLRLLGSRRQTHQTVQHNRQGKRQKTIRHGRLPFDEWFMT